MIYFAVVNKPDNGPKFESIDYKACEREKERRQRNKIACIVERRKAQEVSHVVQVS